MFNTHETFLQAQQLLARPNPAPAGEWYYLPVNPAADPAGKMECYKLPLYFFAPPGTPLPGVFIPPVTLAQLAFSHLETAQLGTPTLNPTGTATPTCRRPFRFRSTTRPPERSASTLLATGRTWRSPPTSKAARSARPCGRRPGA